MKMLMRATSTMPPAPNWKATCPPTVFRPWAGPLKAMAAALCCGGGGRLIEGGLGREQTLDPCYGQCRQRDDGDDPDEDPDAVAAQDEAGQRDGSRERGHRRGKGVASRSRSARSGSFASSSP